MYNLSAFIHVFLLDGVLLMSSYPAVFDRHLDRYKGLRTFFGTETKHLYEFGLCLLGGGISLSAVIATSSKVTIPESKYQNVYWFLNFSRHLAIH